MKNLLLIVCLLVSTSAFAMGTAPQAPSINELQSKITAELNLMDSDLADASRQLSATGLYGDASAAILQNIYNNHPSVVTAATVDPDGRLALIQPDRYKSSQGLSISDQSHFQVLKKTKQPVLSGLFKTVEGFYAVSLACPIFSADGKTTGYISIVFKPDALIGKIIGPYLAGALSFTATAIQKDGLIIYDKDILQIGKMTFSDPLYGSYPDLINLAVRMTQEAIGTGTYTFPPQLGQQPVKKSTSWTTIGLHGTEWRLILSNTI